MMTHFRIDGPGNYVDRLGRSVIVKGRAKHNTTRWIGIAGDGDEACWENNGIMESSMPSQIDIVAVGSEEK